MEVHSIQRIAPLTGHTLNQEEISGLEVGILQRRLEENLSGKIYFWGKIFGSKQDYTVIYCLDMLTEFPTKNYFYCTTSDFKLRAMPTNSADYDSQAEKLNSMFTGDPSFFGFNGEEAEEAAEDPDAPPVERFRELHRLSYVVKKIDRDCGLIPRGAVVMDAQKRVILNCNYEGLSFQTANEKRAYYHFRKPESLQGLALLKRPGVVKSGDFMDCITKDYPQEMWTLNYDLSGTMSHVRNLYWEGYSFYAVIGSSEYGGAYFGLGVPTQDIAFMM